MMLRLFIFLLAMAKQSCGTEGGNGHSWDRPKDDVISESASPTEDNYEEPGRMSLGILNYIANTCASPAAYGARGVFASESTQFEISSTDEMSFKFIHMLNSLEASLVEASSKELVWTNFDSYTYTCMDLNEDFSTNKKYLVDQGGFETFTISWESSFDEITAIIVDDTRYEKQTP